MFFKPMNQGFHQHKYLFQRASFSTCTCEVIELAWDFHHPSREASSMQHFLPLASGCCRRFKIITPVLILPRMVCMPSCWDVWHSAHWGSSCMRQLPGYDFGLGLGYLLTSSKDVFSMLPLSQCANSVSKYRGCCQPQACVPRYTCK